MFTRKSIIYFHLIALILAKNDEGIDLIIEPPELRLQSNDGEGIFYCNSRLNIKQQRSKLIVTIDRPIVTPPGFLLTTEQTNSTTIRIRIKPNGYIGINRINCHWADNATDGQTADLIIGDNPGVIQLKESCRAYDRRYTQCIFKAATFARAFQNGFPPLYAFTEINFEPTAYRSTAKLVDIVNNNTELVFHFEPHERNIIPKKTSMAVNMTLQRFGSSIYRFHIEPLHTTIVDFHIENITSKQLTIRIKHNNSGTISPRLCAGHISQINDQDAWTQVQDITETTEQKISITRLRSSTKYKICLRCYYDKKDHSYQNDVCQPTQTEKDRSWQIGVGIGTIVALLIAIAIVLLGVFRRRRRPPGSSSTIHIDELQPAQSINGISLSDLATSDLRYTPEIQEGHPLINHHTSKLPNGNLTEDDKYQHLERSMNELVNKNKISPDTIDLTRESNTH